MERSHIHAAIYVQHPPRDQPNFAPRKESRTQDNPARKTSLSWTRDSGQVQLTASGCSLAPCVSGQEASELDTATPPQSEGRSIRSIRKESGRIYLPGFFPDAAKT